MAHIASTNAAGNTPKDRSPHHGHPGKRAHQITNRVARSVGHAPGAENLLSATAYDRPIWHYGNQKTSSSIWCISHRFRFTGCQSFGRSLRALLEQVLWQFHTLPDVQMRQKDTGLFSTCIGGTFHLAHAVTVGGCALAKTHHSAMLVTHAQGCLEGLAEMKGPQTAKTVSDHDLKVRGPVPESLLTLLQAWLCMCCHAGKPQKQMVKDEPCLHQLCCQIPRTVLALDMTAHDGIHGSDDRLLMLPASQAMYR